MNNRLLIGVIINVVVICVVLGSFMTPQDIGITDNQGDEELDIKLIKESTNGFSYKTTTNDSYYNYYVKGVLLNLPSNIEGYDLKAKFYGESNEFLHESDENIEYVASNSKVSDIATIGFWGTYDHHNVTEVEIIVIDPKGEIVFNQSVEFDMEHFDYRT